MLTSFLFHSVVLFPTVNYILSRKKFSQTKRLGLVVLFIIAIAFGTVVHNASTWEKNYFEILGVPRSANARDIKQAFRKSSMDAHPDKNPSQEAEQQFVLLSKAHTTLTNDESRDAYDRWGEEGLKWVENSKSIETQGLLSLGVFVFTQFVLVYLLTATVSNTNARSYAYGALGVAIIVLVGMRFGDEDIPIPFFPSMTRDQKCDILGEVFGLVVLTISAVQRAMYVDMDELLMERLRIIEVQQLAILHKTGLLNNAQPKVRGRDQAGEQQQQPGIEPIPARKRFGLPDIPSWAYLVIFMALSSYFNK